MRNPLDHYLTRWIQLLFIFLPLLVINRANAATVDTVAIYSSAMYKSFKCVVISPSVPKKTQS
ncbi:MAG TPA: hypothetical protein VFO70_00135, partial [Chitinophagaceae bacterium]|nr:hypothetical protein [Chitinophagaceae bacterium]